MTGRRILIPLILALPAFLSGCAIGDGIAHLAKLAGEAAEGQDSPREAAPPVPAVAARAQPPAPPPPQAAPRTAIQVESLPPR